MRFHWVAGLLWCLGIVYLLQANQIPLDPWSAQDPVNARTLPQLYGLLLCIAVPLLWLQRRKMAKSSDHSDDTPSNPAQSSGGLLMLLSGAIGTFILALQWLNLWVAVALLLFVLLWLMRERRWKMLLGFSLGLPVAGFLLIEGLLQMSVPIS
jgi:hypothetical protein